MIWNRRKFLTAAAAAAPVALAAPAIAQGKRTLQMVMSWPHDFPGLASIAYNFRDIVNELTDGQLTVNVAAAGELVAAFEVFDAVGSGAADCYHSTPVYLTGQWQPSVFFAQVPFGLTAVEHLGWMYHGGGQALQQKHFRDLFNILPFTAGQTGLQMAGWFNKEVNNLDDFRGLTIRLPGLGGEVMRRLGANAVLIPVQEIFPALQAGTIDATELQGPWLDSVNGLHQYTKFYYAPGWQEVNSAGEIGLNADVWDSLSPQHQAAVHRAIEATNAINTGEWAYYNAEFFRTLIEDHNVDVRSFPEDVIDALATTSAEVVAELATVDERGKEVYDSYMAYFPKALEYSVKTEVPFYQARARQLAAL